MPETPFDICRMDAFRRASGTQLECERAHPALGAPRYRQTVPRGPASVTEAPQTKARLPAYFNPLTTYAWDKVCS